MKSTIKNTNEEAKSDYPCLKIYNEGKDYIVLFSSKKTGVVVWSKYEYCPVSYYGNDWIEGAFSPFNGTIELQND